MASDHLARPAAALALAAATLAIGLAPARAEGPPPPILNRPEVIKLDWNTRGVIAPDLDGDGRQDIALINNDRSRIELLYQRPADGQPRTAPRRVATNRWEPELEDARFDKRPLTAGITIFDLAAGDLNGDGRVDLVYTGDPDVLTIRYQSADGTWDDKRVLDLGKPLQFLTTLKITDLDADKRNDLVVILQKEMVILRQDARGQLGVPERYALADDPCWSLDETDLNGDGRRDLVYMASGRRDGLRARIQQPDATFGPELSYRIEIARSTFQKIPRGEGKSPAFAYVQNQTAMLSVVTLEPGSSASVTLASLKPRVYSLAAVGKTPPAYTVADVDGDGRLDLAIAAADSAQLFVHFQNSAGELGEGRPFPSLPDGRALAAADWDGDGRSELFVASPKEQTVGAARFTPGGRLSYPQPLAVKGKPVALDAGALTAGGKVALAIALEEGGKRRVDFLVRGDGAGSTLASVDLAGLKTDPRAIRLVDANQDGRLDLAVFIPFEPMRLLVQDAAGAFADISATPGYRKGLVDGIDPSALSLADVDGDGKAEMLVAGAGYARVLRLDAAGTLQVVDQFNAREPTSEVAATFAVDADGDGTREIVLLDRKADQFQVLRRNAQGVFIFADALPVSRIDLVGALQVDLNKDGRDDLLLFGKDRFWSVPIGAPDFSVDTVLSYETDLKDVKYEDVAAGDLNGDGVSDFVMIDPRANLIEVLVRDGFTVKSALHFRVFEADPHAQKRGGQNAEPRETLVADVTGDGKNDLLLLVHDRVLVYPSE
jgi:hypothetical protein